MRALAEFIMRGRLQAALVAAAGNLVPLLSTATVGLVALRRSSSDGLLVAAWAALPVSVIGAFSTGVNLLVAVVTLAALLVVLLGAQVLKATVSWSASLLACIAGTVLSVLLMQHFFSTQLAELEQALAAFFQEIARQAGQEELMSGPSVTMLLGVIAYATLLNVMASLLVSRWWQAMLYNPGGFRTEMHQFRLGLYPAVLLAVAVTGCYVSQPDYLSWASFFGLPLLMSGLCLVHYLVANSGLGTLWLVMVYVAIVLFGPMTLLLMFVGVADSLFNIRSRITRKGNSGE